MSYNKNDDSIATNYESILNKINEFKSQPLVASNMFRTKVRELIVTLSSYGKEQFKDLLKEGDALNNAKDILEASLLVDNMHDLNDKRVDHLRKNFIEDEILNNFNKSKLFQIVLLLKMTFADIETFNDLQANFDHNEFLVIASRHFETTTTNVENMLILKDVLNQTKSKKIK